MAASAPLMMVGLLVCMVFGQVARAADDEAGFFTRVQADTQWLDAYGTRQIGTEAHRRVQDDLLARLRSMPGVKVWTDEFPVVAPVYDEVSLHVAGGPAELNGRHDIFALWPDVGRLNTTLPEGIGGRLIYVGDASHARLPASSLRGNIAVMEMSAYRRYRRAFDRGAAAVIFLESGEAGEPLPSQQSLYKPRYYVKAGPLADALRAGTLKTGRIVCRGKWKTVTARNIYVATKPADSKDVAPYAVVAPYDSMSLVAGLAPGADAAIDCAVALNLLRDEAAKPSRALVFGFLDAYHINQLGVRRMAAMLTVTPEGLTRKQYDEIEQQTLDEYEEASAELELVENYEQGLNSLRDRGQSPHLRRIFKDIVGRELLRLRELQGDLRLAAARTEKENDSIVRRESLMALVAAADWLLAYHEKELEDGDRQILQAARAFAVKQTAPPTDSQTVAAEWTDLAASVEQAKLVLPICTKPVSSRNRVLNALFGGEGEIPEKDLPVARSAWEATAKQVKGRLAEQKSRASYFEPLDELRAGLAEHFGLPGGADQRVCNFLAGIDISDCGVIVGPGLMDGYNRVEPKDRDFLRALKRAVKRGDLWPEDSPTRRVVNIGAIEGREGHRAESGFRALISVAAESFLLPGVTWVTDAAPRQRVDTAMDRYDQIDWSRIQPQLPPSREFFHWLFTTEDFTSTPKTVEEATSEWVNGMGSVVDISAGETVPRVPRRGFLITLVGSAADTDGIRRHEFAWTGYDGTFRLPLLCRYVTRQHDSFHMHALKLDENGAIVESVSTSESMVTARLATTFSLRSRPGEQLPRAVSFRCTELNGPSFFDARFLEPLTEATLMDAIRGGVPKQYTFSMDKSGQMWGLVEPGTRWQLIVRAGATGARMALLNAPLDARKLEIPEREAFRRGFRVDQPLPSIPSFLAAQDFFTLDEWRLTDFRAAGISSDKIDEIRQGTQESLAQAAVAMEADDGAGLARASVRALANEIRAYRAVKETGQDVARGAIFLMLMLLPFSIAMERLIFACARIGRQITAAILIFALMTLVLWSFHPAFRISAQPLVIVMAFTILALSLAVISMVLGRFRAAVREFQSTLAEGSGAQMGRGGLLGSAVFLGIANMRKRKVRTALTGATIILVTFALLCFSSASSYVDKKEFRLDDVQATNPSVLVRRPSFGPISWDAVDGIANLVQTKGVTLGARAWLAPQLGDTEFRVFAYNRANGAHIPALGVLGLPANEDRLTGVDQVLPNWQTFAEQGGCYLPEDIAERLAVKAGDSVVVRGRELTVRGVFDPFDLEDKITLLDSQRILPYDYSRQEKDWVNRNSQGAIEQETESAAAMQPTSNDAERFLPASETMILPTEIVRQLNGELRSVGLACGTAEQSAEVARSLMQSIVYPSYFANDKGGVSVVVATPLIAVPPKNLAVPLVIAALIIFTTMLNSVSERKKEIYVYSSLGLAPVHIGAMFIAEALTYGLMGAVFGYIAGQAVATLLTAMGMMQGITLNYSGTAVINTMLLVQVVVVFAAFVPAIMAGKIASPSKEMSWKVPEPVDGEIRDTLPFTVSLAAAPGLIAFIHEYLEAHRDGVLGHFDVDTVQVVHQPGDGCVAALDARVWLAPFDMGVCQRIRMSVQQPDDGVCAITVAIQHETGTPKVWWRLNKPFFYELRRQLLGWRKVTPERVQEYVDRMSNVATTASEAVQPWR